MGLGRGHGFLAPAPWPLLGRTTTWPTRYDSAGVALTPTCHPPRSSILSLSVAYQHGRPGSRGAGGRAPRRSVPALGVCLRLGLRVRFTGPRSCVLPARLYVVAIAARPVLGARRAFARLRYRLAHRLARRAALWCVLAPAVPRRCVGVTVCPSSSPARPSARPHPRRRRRGAKPPATGHGPCPRWKIIAHRRAGRGAERAAPQKVRSKLQVIEKITWS